MKTPNTAKSHRRLGQSGPIVLAALCAISLLMAGCGNKEAAAPAPVTPLKGQAPAVATTTATPEQEAVKQKAIQDGPAIEAALKAQQEGHK